MQSFYSKTNWHVQVKTIGSELGEGFDLDSNVQMLCPHCCSSDMFVRSAAVHAFERIEVENCKMLNCSRYHVMPSSHVAQPCMVKFRQGIKPLIFPECVEKLTGIDWSFVRSGGVLGAKFDDPGRAVVVSESKSQSSAEEPGTLGMAEADLDVTEIDSVLSGRDFPEPSRRISQSEPTVEDGVGTFLSMSFFVLSGQVQAGDCLHPDEVERFDVVVKASSEESSSCKHTLRLRGDREVELQFRYKLGDTMPCQGARKVQSIHDAAVGDKIHSTPSRESFSSLDNVLVVFERGPDDKPHKPPPFILFAGSRNNLRLCRLTSNNCSSNITAACCWSELQDHFEVVMGPEFQNYEITALTLYRNDERAHKFLRHMNSLKQRQRGTGAPWEDCATITASAIPILQAEGCAQYRQLFETGPFDWMWCGSVSDADLKKELERLSVRKEHISVVLAFVKDNRKAVILRLKQLQHTFDAQKSTMRHFKDHSTKFGLLPVNDNTDINLTLAWWGNWRGSAV